uniref:Uncharacterized protein n=1 Tax=Arundo donax TaxID=35708 RepID=A0A0A8ZWN1_ARUDO
MLRQHRRSFCQNKNKQTKKYACFVDVLPLCNLF